MRRARDPKPSPPRRHPVALLHIDFINDFEFEHAERLYVRALPAARRAAALAERARAAGVPIIYANDNFGHWRSDLRAQVEHCLSDGVRGSKIAELLQPQPDDYFVLKPKNSAFFATPLEPLLAGLGATTLILTGLAGDNCVLFSAHDAHMRDYRLVVPSDCIASESPKSNRWALDHMKRFLDAETAPSARVDFARLKRRRPPSRQERGVTGR